MQQSDAVPLGLPHAEDASATYAEARVPDRLQRVEPVLVSARRDHFTVELRRRVEIVVVVVEARLLQFAGLLRRQHAEGRAGLEAERAHLAHHLLDLLELLRLRIAVCGAHAESGRALGLGGLSRRHHVGDLHEVLTAETGVVAHALRAVLAVFGTSARLDGQQGADLDAIGVEVLAMHALRVEQQVVERQFEDGSRFGQRPVGAHFSEPSQVG
jgi:hypothetical protein